MERLKLSLKRHKKKSPEKTSKKVKMESCIEPDFADKPIESENEIVLCDICNKDLTHMNVQRRTQHINRCADEQIERNSGPPVVVFCPFCRKDISQSNKMTHLKICGRINGITDPQKLIEIYQLMERQAHETSALGIPKVTNAQKPKETNKKKITSSAKLDPDLQTALALSLSLKEANDRKFEAEMMELGIPIQSTSDRRTRKTKQKPDLPILMTRTPKEREELIQMKISELLDDDNEVQILTLNDILGTKSDIRKPKKIPILWRKSACPDVVFDRSLFYVTHLRAQISPCKTDVGAKRKSVSQIPGRGATQIHTEPQEVDEIEENGDESVKKYSETDLINSSGFFKKISEEQINRVDYLVTDYASMVGNPELSDVRIRTKNGEIDAHRFVFYARCPSLYEETKGLNDQSQFLDWTNVSSDSAKAFLTFLYSAQVNWNDENIRKQVEILAQTYDVHQLVGRAAEEKSFEIDAELNSSEKTQEMDVDCVSPELLPIDSDYDENLSDDERPVSPSIHSAVNVEKSFKYPLPFRPGTSTPVNSDEKQRFFSISTLKDDSESNQDNEIQPTCSSPIITNFSETQNSSFGGALSDDGDKTQPICPSSPIISSVSHQNELSDSLFPKFGANLLDSSRTCYSQPASFEDNDLCHDFIDHWPTPKRSTTDQIITNVSGDSVFDISILPLADRLRKCVEPVQSEIDARPMSEVPNNAHPSTPKTCNLNVKGKLQKRRRRIRISSSQPIGKASITPKPNYIDMSESAIKQQLNKFGLRQLPAKKAVKMLQHIYEGTHPLVTDSEHENSTLDNLQIASSEDDLNESREEMLEETCFLDDDDGESAQPTDSICEKFKKYVKTNPQIYTKILTYQPLNLHDLHSQIKSSGLKISLPTLKELLDKQCITFTVPRDRSRPTKTRKANK